MSRRVRACARALRFESLRTSVSPIITLPSAVMFWNRLKRWKTIPTSPGRGGRPSSETVPASGGSSRQRQRSSVDFPEPDGPMITFTWPRSTSNVTPRSTSSSP